MLAAVVVVLVSASAVDDFSDCKLAAVCTSSVSESESESTFAREEDACLSRSGRSLRGFGVPTATSAVWLLDPYGVFGVVPTSAVFTTFSLVPTCGVLPTCGDLGVEVPTAAVLMPEFLPLNVGVFAGVGTVYAFGEADDMFMCAWFSWGGLLG